MSRLPHSPHQRLVIGCVAEADDKYLDQAARLLLSLRWFGGRVADADFLLCVVGRFPPPERTFFERHGARILEVDRVDAGHGPSNKLRFLEQSLLDDYDRILLLDCDTLVVRDPSPWLDGEGIGVKVADMPTLTSDQLQALYREFDLSWPGETLNHDVTGEPCGPYFNSGVILLQAGWRHPLIEAWSRFNDALLARGERPGFNPFHTDQASLSLAITASAIPVTALPTAMNLPCHLPARRYPAHFFGIDPCIVHYHGLGTRQGYVRHSALEQTNRRIDSFNARLRAERAPAIGARLLLNHHPDGSPIASLGKVVVGSGWWSDGRDSEWSIGDPRTRSPAFFHLWLHQVLRYITPHRIAIVDSHAPDKPDWPLCERIQWIELDRNYGHANDIRTGRIDTRFSGFTRSVLLSCLYAIGCDADWFVYIEQDCLIRGARFLEQAIGDRDEGILIGQPTRNGRGLHGGTAAPMKQQSLMIADRAGMTRLVTGLLDAPWSDGELSPELIMERQLQPLGTVCIPYGRSRPIDFDRDCFYAQHLTSEELENFLVVEGLDQAFAALHDTPFHGP